MTDISQEEKSYPDLEIYLYDKSYVCPVCDSSFKAKAVKTRKLKLVSTHTDLRPCYEPIDSIMYDVIICDSCGYASQIMFFSEILSKQAAIVREKISYKFKTREYPAVLTPKLAIFRYKLALINYFAINAKDSKIAYTALKIAWLYRSMGNDESEMDFLTHALERFKIAFENEPFPICKFDGDTYTYLLGELSRRLGQYDDAMKYISKVIASKSAGQRIKSRALDIKELIKKHS